MTLNIYQELYFPTSIYIYDIKDPTAINQEVEKNILKWQQEDPKGVQKTNHGGWHSPTTMQDKPEYQQLIAELFGMMNQIFKKEQLEPSVGLGNMWANINPPRAWNRKHNHANAFFSGVYYVKVPAKAGKLELHDPRPGPQLLRPRQKTENLDREYWRSVSFDPQEGRIIIFPSWLEHEVKSNESNDIRISISFNFIQR
jgi:uncharacterized protein (TIGR02466 family)